MATREQLRLMIRSEPFRPFRINLAGGRSFTVKHPETVSCSLNGRELVVHDEAGMHLVEMLMVEVIEPIQAPADSSIESNGA